MDHQEKFQVCKNRAERKLLRKEQLKPSEKIAMNGEWFFTIPLPMPVIERILNEAKKTGSKPSDIGRVLIYKALQGVTF